MRLKCEFRHLKTDDEREIVVTLNGAEIHPWKACASTRERKRRTFMRKHTPSMPIARSRRTAGGIRSRRPFFTSLDR
jgi:hypothetical protein